MSNASGVFSELRRRKVIHTAVVYIALAWAGIEVVTTLLPVYGGDRRPYSDTLDAHFGQVLIATYSVRDLTAYETLKQRGLNTVTNDSLRAAIGHLYGVAYPNFSGFQQLEEKLVWQPQGVQPRGGRP